MTSEEIKDWQEYLARSRESFYERYVTPKASTVNKADFLLTKTIGQGAYGVVVVAKCLVDKEVYAVKILDKKYLVAKRHVRQTLEEKRLLGAVKFPFIVHMEHFFKDNSYLYLVMPFVPGGELFGLLRKAGKFEERRAVFYAAQVALALEYLHNASVIYRDLKPENILLSADGYVKLTDLGFAKVVEKRTYTLCGTADYLAPEVIMSRGYGHGVDWWAFGVLAYEMCAGVPPFFAKDPTQTLRQISTRAYRCPPAFSPELTSLLDRLLELDTTRRLGCLKNGAEDIKNHSWFAGVFWLDLVNKKVKPPYLPSVRYRDDTINFQQFDDWSPRIHVTDLYEKEFQDF